MKTTSTALALILAASGAAQAQDVTYLSYGLSFERTESGGNEIDLIELDGAVEYRINQIYLMASLDHTDFSQSGGGFNFNTTNINARVGYQITPQILAYIGAGTAEAVFIRSEAIEAGAQYDNGTFGVGLAYRDIHASPFKAYELAATYAVSPNVSVGLSYLDNTEIDASNIMLFGSYDAGPLSVDGSIQVADNGGFGSSANLFNINAAYEFGGQFRAMGGLAVSDPDGGGGGATAFEIGGGYQVSDGMWIDASIGQVDFNGGGGNSTFGLALTYETGNRALITDRTTIARERNTDLFGAQGAIFGGLEKYGF